MAPRAEEGRDKLRKAAPRSTYPKTRGCPNGETHLIEDQVPGDEKDLSYSHQGGTRGTETSKYPEEKKANAISQVAASERDTARYGNFRHFRGRAWEGPAKSVKPA